MHQFPRSAAPSAAALRRGKQGLVRNLSSAEFLDQVILASRAVGRLVINVVVMVMGEPLHKRRTWSQP
jgi:adenine C2-methylase RlmN of 23S rRNA A2503 and tRNA A37